MKQRSLANQHLMLNAILERFDAVDVTGMDAWERARAVHGRTAAGLDTRSGGEPAVVATPPSPDDLSEQTELWDAA